MKAVVLEIRKDKAAVMTKDGQILKIRNKHYNIGQELNMTADVTFMRRFAPLAGTAAAALVFLGSGAYAYAMPYGIVSLDVNPSIEYTINRFDRVLSVTGINDDGRDILSEIDNKSILHKNIETAVEATIEQIEADGYLKGNDGNYVVVTANTKKETYTDELIYKLDESMQDNMRGHDGVYAIAMKATDEDVREAHKQGISAGKMMIQDNRFNDMPANRPEHTDTPDDRPEDAWPDNGADIRPMTPGDGDIPGEQNDRMPENRQNPPERGDMPKP